MSKYLLLTLIGISYQVYGDSDLHILEESVYEAEIGIDWWDILNADATCCPGNTDEASCNAEAGSNCVWFPKPNNAIALAAGSQCVGTSFVKCKRRGGIDACCTPKCNPSGPNSPLPPGQQGPIQTPPVCGPAVTPAPITPSPVTPSPTTPAPTHEACDIPPEPYNIQLILDESGSVGAYNYDASVDFVKQLVTDLIDADSPISLYSFSNEVDELHSFADTQSPRTQILHALDNAKSTAGNYQGRCTDTMSALQGALADYQDANDNGNLEDPGKRYLFLITDGVPYCGCGLPSTCNSDVCGSNTEAIDIRNLVNSLGIRLVVIGIGQFDITTIECLADPNDVFQVAGFTDADFNLLVSDVRPILCDEQTTTPPRTTPSPTTGQPTSSPTTACALGVNYQFAGTACKISGDPHTTMFNGDKHDMQGTPGVEYPANSGKLRNMFYYLHPCAGVSNEDMPVKIAAKQFYWGSRPVSGIDSFTVILTEAGGARKYFIYLHSTFAYLADVSVTTISSDIDIAMDNNAALQQLTAGTLYNIGDRFTFHMTDYGATKKYFRIQIDGDDLYIYMQGQSSYVGGHLATGARQRMHYVQITVPDSLKCYACGICGDFNTYNTGQTWEQMPGCDGNMVDYRPGTYEAVSFDTYGWTWEKYFVDDGCQVGYDNTDNNLGNDDTTDPCTGTFKTAVEDACQAAYDAQSNCCAQIGIATCNAMLANCKVDACVGADGDLTAIDDEVADVFTEPIAAVCANNMGGGGDPPAEVLECPSGSVVVGYNGQNNDIGGCGIDACDERYDYDSIDECELACQDKATCNAFSYAPLGGDQNHVGKKVCSLYTSATPNQQSGPNQIFCKIVTRTCTLTLYTMADDNQYVYKKVGTGDYSEIARKEGWGQPLTTIVTGITTDTYIAVTAVNSGGGPGGFISKLVVTNDADGTSVTRRTDQPLSTWLVYDNDIGQGSDITSNLNYIQLGDVWSGLTSSTRPDYAGAVWIDVGTHKAGTIYTFYYNNLANDMADVGCISRSELHGLEAVKIFEIKEEDNNNTYIKSFGIVGLILLLCGMTLYYRKYRNNKLDGYEPLNGINSEEINPFLKESKVQV